MFKIYKTTDEKLRELGFIKTREDKYGAEYRRFNKTFDYTHCVEICHKKSAKHIIQSYSIEGSNSEYSPVVGLTYTEMKLFTKKMKQLGLKSI